ncbi:AAA family ATPase [Phytohabitans aurantiacus]|uniref:AAA family ATPase n=1 Tax=Phytohabitans aurantiacus TaxID=3016789 RepID=UPI0024919BD0|nr:AAA family ATPase [Phytohabitans aurantiacus]
MDVPAGDPLPASTVEPAAESARFRPSGQHDLAPSGEVERIRANLDAVRALARQLQQRRPATADEQVLYARWSGWGATPALFDERPKHAGRFAAERAELQALLGDDGYRAARTTTLNAHYTDAAYVQIIWDAVMRLGFSGGRVLEPGCGSGNFLGFAPTGARLVGVELDPTTAQITQALYPDADIRAESFADTRLPEPGFDLVIGNVPFGSHKLHDPRYNPGREYSIHNHFIIKSLHATRPGGLVALITSRYTMDGADLAHQHAREQMAALADLVGAVRLPINAHQVAAGTEVVTDLLIFRRRPDGKSTAAAVPQWLRVRPVDLPAARDSVNADTFEVNEYFLEQPQMVLGDQLTDSGRSRPVLTVRGSDPDTGATLRSALDSLVPKPQVVLRSPEPQMQEGLFVDEGDGRFSQIRDGRRVRHEPARTQIVELRALIGLRETLLALLDEEAANRDDTPRMAALRAQLNSRYDAYRARFEAINRFQLSAGTRVDKKTGQVVETERRINPRMGGFRDDPFFPYVAALEKFDDESGQAQKAEVFSQRVITVPNPVQRVQEPDDALVVCWDRHNEVRLDVVASLLGLDHPQQAREALGDLVFEEPGSGELIRKAEYLSGNVRRKLVVAQQAAHVDARFEVNVQALQSVVPRDLTPVEIGARLGSPWIAADYVQQFLREILEDDTVTVSNIGARWSVKGGDKKGVLATTVWGTKSRPATDLAENLLNSQTIEITKTVGTGSEKKTVRDTEATAFAQAKAQQVDERFRAWLWEEPDRAATLGRIYNDRFNARIPRTYEGEHVEAPGLSLAFPLHPHQMAAVARIRNTPGVGLFHGTGAGKTLEMIVGGMELVRLGLVTKPCYVVPKGVLGQFRREFLQAYPRAKVLAADSEDLTGDKRRQFVARCSTGDWDAIIISHHAFKKIPVSRAVRVDYLNKQLDRLRKHLANSEGADRYTVKDIEKQVQTLQQQITEQLAAPSDPGVEFERTGIGYLFIDEAHVYKNLRVISSIRELAHDGNDITADLEMKLEYLRRTGRRVVTLATATPIDNSPSEILTMTKYAAPELLAEMGVEEDDQYHAAFIQPRRRVEMRPDGSGFESRTRHSRYVNLPEQKQLMYSWADVKLKEHLDLGEPAIIGGQPEVLAVPASPELHGHLVMLAARAKKVTGGHPDERLNSKGEFKKDNILWISTDGRTASLDLRLIGDHTDGPQKIDVAADRIAEIWRAHRDDIYYRSDGTPEPVRGSLQLVFCDLGVPRRDRWTVYEGLRDELAARGVPPEQIRFAQEAKNRQQKEQLDQDARDGKIAVLIGSRQGLGTGRNIQRRVISVLQLDPTWKLTPVTQSLGRGQRQGNDNTAIHHIFVVTENSYDPFLWQKVDDKARFTRQMLDPNDTTRVIDAQEQDDDGGKIDPAVMFAVAAGRPELLELHRTEEAVGALRLEARIWSDEQFTLTATVKQNQHTITGLRRSISDLNTVLARRRDTRGDAFRMTLEGTTFDSRADAGAALVRRLQAAVHAGRGREHLQLGELGGIILSAGIEAGLLGDRALLRLDGIADSMIELTQRDLDALAASSSADQIGLIRKLENKVAGADDLRKRYLDSIDRLQANIDRATARIGLPFPQQADLDRHADQLAELHKQLQILDTASPNNTPDGGTAPAEGAPARGGSAVGESNPTARPAADVRRSRADADHAANASGSAGADTGQQRRDPDPRPAGGAPNDGQPLSQRETIHEAGILEHVLAQANLTTQQRDWLTGQIPRLTSDPRVAMTARSARDYDEFPPVFDPALEELLLSAADNVGSAGEALAIWYFSTDPQFRAAFSQAAGHTVYEQVRATPTPGSIEPVRVDSSPNDPSHVDHAAAPQPTLSDREVDHPAIDPTQVVPARGGLVPTAGDEPGTIQINGNSVLVYGTDKSDSQMCGALSDAGFKWYRSLQRWGLPRSWHHDTRMRRVAQLLRRMREHGRILPVEDPNDRRFEDRPAAGPLTVQMIAKADLRVGDQVRLWVAGAGTHPWRGLGSPNDERFLIEGVYAGITGLDGQGELLDLVVTDSDGRRDELGWRVLVLPEALPVLRAESTASQSVPKGERNPLDTATPSAQLSAHAAEPGPASDVARSDPEPFDLTPRQQAVIDELGMDRGEPWSIRREWRIRTFVQLSTKDYGELRSDVRQALTTDLHDSLASPAWRERATARRLLERWSGSPTAAHTEAQEQAIDALCQPASSQGMPDPVRLAAYGRLTMEEYRTLDSGYQQDIQADLKAIAESGATKIISRNRSGIGATVRTVADHVTGAQDLLRRLRSNPQMPPLRSNATSVTNTAEPAAPVSDIPSAAPLVDESALAHSDGNTDPEQSQEVEAGAVQLAIPLRPAVEPRPEHATTAAAVRHDTTALSAEQRLLQKVAAGIPDNVVQWPSTPDGHPTVLVSFVANGTYGEVSGVDVQREPITARGYVIEAQGLRGGYGGWHPDALIVVKLGETPDGPTVHTVQTEMDARLTVLDPPSPDMPAGEPAPWLRMPVEHQILAARTALGLTIEIRNGPANELWTVEGCPEQITGEVAWWLFGGRYRSWDGRARPVFRPQLVQEATTAGRIPAEPEQLPVPVPEPPPSPDQNIEARLARLYPYTEPGPLFRRAVAEAVTYARMKLDAGLDPSRDLMEGEVGAGLRPRADLAARHDNGLPPASESISTAPSPTWLAGVTLGEEAPTADGRHHVYRRSNGRATSVYVDARHPQAGMLPRGRLELTSDAETHGPPKWRIVDHDSTSVGEHTGTYLEAEAKLLAATAELDEPVSDADADPHSDADLTPATGAFATTQGEPSAAAPAAPTWSERIQIIDGPTLLVRGTTGAPRENGLRGLLKQYRFQYRGASGEWRYTGRLADRAAAIGDIRRWLAAQDRADAARTAKPTTALPPTTQQQRIIDSYQAGHTIAVQALAGTGKTSTLQMLAAVRPETRVAYIAFNRSIADEAQRKFGRNVRADTSHAFAREALDGTPLRGKLDRIGKGARWPEEWAEHLNIALGGAQELPPEDLARLVMATVRTFRESAADTIGSQHLPASVPTEVAGLGETVLSYARAAWQDIADPDGKLLFDHDDYLKLWALRHPRLPCDVVFFDEAQDINPVLRKVIQDQPMQTVVVGDSNQSIYGFRGAIDALKNWPVQSTLPLTQSWRFGPAVADVGNQFLRLLGSPWLLAGNPALDSRIGLVDDPDAILARTNAGAVAGVFDAFDRGKRVALMGGGRAIEDIAKAAKDLQAGRGTKHVDLSRFTDWDEVRAYVEDGDGAQSLRAFVRLVDRRGADGLLQMVKELADEDQTDADGNPDYDVIVSTVHKAKGREWAQVQIADDFPQPQQNQETGEVQLPDAEQLRLAYVAVTRARYRLELGSLSWIEDFSEHTDRAATAASRSLAQRESTVADPVADIRSSVQFWLSSQPDALDIPVGKREWLARSVADLVNDHRVRRAAFAHEEEDFGRVFEPALEDRLVNARDADANNSALLLYLSDEDFAEELSAYARHVVYSAIKGCPESTDSDTPARPPTHTDGTGNLADQTSRESPGPTAPRTPTQLARLDTAVGAQQGHVAPAGRAGRPITQSGASRRAAGM